MKSFRTNNINAPIKYLDQHLHIVKLNTSRPKPFAPISDATTTIAKLNITFLIIILNK